MESFESSPRQNKRVRRCLEWLILLLAVLMVFGCVFCSSGLALSFWPERMAPASLLAKNQAHYSRGPADDVRYAVLDPAVVAQAATDIARLQLTPDGGGSGSFVRVVALPATPTATSYAQTTVSTPAAGATPAGLAPTSWPSTPVAVESATTTPAAAATATAAAPTVTPVETSTGTSLPNTPTPLAPTVTATPVPATVTATPLPVENTPTAAPPTSTPVSDPADDPPAMATPIPPTATPTPPAVAFEMTAFSGNESEAGSVITVSLSAAAKQIVTVDYGTSDVNAKAGQDYTAISDTLTFDPGNTSQTFIVSFLDDPLDEQDETLHLTLSKATNAEINGANPATLTIIDDDASPEVGFMVPELAVTEGDEANATILVTLTAASALPITVTYAIDDGTAKTSDSDYAATSGTLTFAPGQTSRIFQVSVLDDLQLEANESVQLSLQNPVNATLGTASAATLWIIDDDSGGGCTGNSTIPNVGSPDGVIAQIGCDSALIIDLDSTPIETQSGYDFVYYEQENPSDPNHIALDWVIVQVGVDASGPWYTVFYWGDGLHDANTNLPENLLEDDNKRIPMDDPTPLYGTTPYTTGITIDVDQRAPAGTYRFVRIYSPSAGANEPSEVDAIQLLP